MNAKQEVIGRTEKSEGFIMELTAFEASDAKSVFAVLDQIVEGVVPGKGVPGLEGG